MKKILSALLFTVIIQQSSFASTHWTNDLREKFLAKEAVFYTINMRTFNAQDLNGNDIIEEEYGEKRGTFINAIEKLDYIKSLGVNTIYLLPITKTGKLKALGTAGSLYALDSFDEISPYLDDKDDPRTVEEEAKLFIDEAHKRNLRVVIDIPACGSYDLTLARPTLFLRNKKEDTVIPSDWTDVRLFKIYEERNQVNSELVNAYKSFVDMVQNMGADGIRADVAGIKPYKFWEDVISYARKKDSNFMFVAEISASWKNPIKPWGKFASIEELLDAGFDGFYSNLGEISNIETKKEFAKKFSVDEKILKKYEGRRAVLGTFATHDQISPTHKNSKNYWEQVLWLNLTLPINSYFLDGFPSGDSFDYKFENKKATTTSTDDDFYFLHSGKMDIFNFSRQPLKEDNEYSQSFMEGARFNKFAGEIVSKGKFKKLKTNSDKVFAHMMKYKEDRVIAIINLDKENDIKAKIVVPKLNKKSYFLKIKASDAPKIKRRRIITKLEAGEIQVFVFSKRNKEGKL